MHGDADFDEQITRRDECWQSIADSYEAMRFENKAAHDVIDRPKKANGERSSSPLL